MFVSSDRGKAVRFIITHQGDPASVEGIQARRRDQDAVGDASRGTPLENAKVSLGRYDRCTATCSTAHHRPHDRLHRGDDPDFRVMLVITRSVVAATW